MLGETYEELAASIAVPECLFMQLVKQRKHVPSYIALLLYMRERDLLTSKSGSKA